MVKAFKSTKDNVISVVGTGDPLVDTPRFAAAVAAADAYYVAHGRPATVLIDREVHITGKHIFTRAAGLECTKGSWLVREDTTAMVCFGGDPDNAFGYLNLFPGEQAAAVVTDIAAGSGVISMPYNYQLGAGDWVLIYGFNTLADVTPHSAGMSAFPMELQRINRRASTGACNASNSRCDYVFDDFLDEPYTTVTVNGQLREPRARKISVISGIRIRNFNYKMKDGAYSAAASPIYSGSLYFERCVDVELSNCCFGPSHPGTTKFYYCANVRRHGCIWSGLENFEYDSETGAVYGINDSVCTNVDVQHCMFGGMRHAYTTGGATAGLDHYFFNYRGDWSSSTSYAANDGVRQGTTYWRALRSNSNVTPGAPGSSSDWVQVKTDNRLGAVKSVIIHGNTFGNNGRLSGNTLSGMVMVNPHCEGRRITISDNHFNVPGEQAVQNRGISVRFRDAVIRNNTFNCGPAATPIAIYGARATVSNNTFNGGLRCEVLPLNGFTNVDKVRFSNNTFRNFYSPAIYISTGTDHEIIGNAFENCAYSATGGYQQAVVQFAGLSSGGVARVKDNSINKYQNVYSVHTGTLTAQQITLDGNLCQGYANTSMGLDRTLANTPEIEMRNLHRNNEGIRLTMVQQTAHGLTTASIGRPITPAHAVLNDTAGAQDVYGILADVVDANHYLIYHKHDPFEMPLSMAVAGYSFPSSGRDLYWDQSQAKYVATKPGDSVASAAAVIRVHAYKSTSMLVSLLV